jgi:hypothetical protein
LLLYFSVTLFVSAALLFLVQPMIGKMILPHLGGTPAVWNTCMVFFQGMLLVGYGYTHFLTRVRSARRQVLIQVVMLFFPLLVLPFALGDWEPPTDTNPVFQLLWKLVLMVGLPFFAVSTTAPLLQKWFAHTGHPASRDPYFLYGASNLGSMLGLLLYPTVIEPWLPVSPAADENTWATQVHLWTFGFAVFLALVIGCAAVVWQAIGKEREHVMPAEPAPLPDPIAVAAAPVTAVSAAPPKRKLPAAPRKPDIPVAASPPSADRSALSGAVTVWRRLRWIGLAAAPTSLMLGVTTNVTTDIAAVPAFWILPLALYLLTFILVFARWPIVWTETPHTVVLFLQPCFLLFLVLRIIAHLSPPTWGELLLHLAAFFTTALMCHGELAKDRPGTKHLTEFYFWMSLGGVLGGLFNALIAPIVFQTGIWEYPITMAFACLLRANMVEDIVPLVPGDSTADRPTPFGQLLDWTVPIAIGVSCYLMAYVGDNYVEHFFLLRRSYLLAALVVVVLALSLRPVRFGLSVGALFLAAAMYDRSHESLLYEARGFFGLLRVRETKREMSPLPVLENTEKQFERKTYRVLLHGNIDHGRQIVDYETTVVVVPAFIQSTIGMGATPLGSGSFLAATLMVPGRFDKGYSSERLNLYKRREATSYFHERNGVAEIYRRFSWPDARLPASMVGLMCGDNPVLGMLVNTQSEPPFAVLGLGTGILASYAKPYQAVHFYEIDPLVKRLSIVPGYVPPWDSRREAMPTLPDPIFYYVHDAQERWSNIDVILGDGRLKIKEAPEKYYHIISLDAFSSDAIPVHLLTAEAVELYMSKLADGGVLIFNTTNRYVRIEGVLAAIARAKGYECLHCADYGYSDSDYPQNKEHPDRFSADWVVLQRKIDKKTYRNGGPPIAIRLDKERKRLAWDGSVLHEQNGNAIIEDRWHPITPLPGPIWTDAYSNMFKIMRWQ